MGSEFISQIVSFVQEMFKGLNNGIFFFGGPIDIIRYIADILLITFVLYKLLCLMRETRAWQLLRGALLIVLFFVVSSLLGLEVVNFLFNSLLYVVAIAFVVIFQPELRRALEAVGLKSFSSLSNAISPDEETSQSDLAKMIDEVVAACVKMGKQYTGALIIFERSSRLSELIDQENAVALDSDVSDAMLQSIFYKGSPLHDGAILIRGGRIAAARCHIPLADNVHVRDDLGTRHRAAIGASELGDAIAVAVSEERGTISLAVAGILHQMQNGQDLRKNLRFLLGVENTPVTIAQRIKQRYRWPLSRRKNKASPAKPESSPAEVCLPDQDGNQPNLDPETAAYCRTIAMENPPKEPVMPTVTKKKSRIPPSRRVFYLVVSLLISASLWLYIQVTTNPVVTRTMTASLQFKSAEVLTEQGLAPEYPVTTVSISLVGRQKQINSLTSSDLQAFIDFSGIENEGVKELPIEIESSVSEYFRIESKNPETITVNIYRENFMSDEPAA